MKQIYEHYTKEDHEVWSILFGKQMANLREKACTAYLECTDAMKSVLNEKRLPDYSDLDELLLRESGWSIEVVEGLIPVREFYALLSRKKICAPAWIRKMDQIDYLEEPDMFHDIIGHIPLFLNRQYADYVQRIGEIGVRHSGNEVIEAELERIYWFTSEFGLMRENDELKVYGAGVISSYGETQNILNPEVEILDLNLEKIINSRFRTDIIQPKYFVIHSFDDLNKLLDAYESSIRVSSTPINYTVK